MFSTGEYPFARQMTCHGSFTGQCLVAGTVGTGQAREYIILPDVSSSTNTPKNVYLYLWGELDPWKQVAHNHTSVAMGVTMNAHGHDSVIDSHPHDFTEDYMPEHLHVITTRDSYAHFYSTIISEGEWISTPVANTTAGTAAGTTTSVAPPNPTISNYAAHTRTLSGSFDSTGDGVSTEVPNNIQIWIDDGTGFVNRTAAIGDPNAKGATMYDSINNDWGVGVTEWNTGKIEITSYLNLASIDGNKVEFRSNGDCTSGRLNFVVVVI